MSGGEAYPVVMAVVLGEGSRGDDSTYTHGQAWRCFFFS